MIVNNVRDCGTMLGAAPGIQGGGTERNPEEQQLNLKHLIIGEPVGGRATSFHEAFNFVTNEKFALKMMPCSNDTDYHDALNDVQSFCEVNHPFIATTYGHISKEFRVGGELHPSHAAKRTWIIYILFEPKTRSLEDLIADGLMTKKRKISVAEMQKIVFSTSIGLALFQKLQKSRHGTIKPCNIILAPDQVYKLSNVGTVSFPKLFNKYQKERQTPDIRFWAPEALRAARENRYSRYDIYRSDIFSLGLCLLQAALTTEIPRLNDPRSNELKQEIDKYISQTEGFYGASFGHLLRKMLQVEAKFRPDCTNLVYMQEFLEFTKTRSQDIAYFLKPNPIGGAEGPGNEGNHGGYTGEFGGAAAQINRVNQRDRSPIFSNPDNNNVVNLPNFTGITPSSNMKGGPQSVAMNPSRSQISAGGHHMTATFKNGDHERNPPINTKVYGIMNQEAPEYEAENVYSRPAGNRPGIKGQAPMVGGGTFVNPVGENEQAQFGGPFQQHGSIPRPSRSPSMISVGTNPSLVPLNQRPSLPQGEGDSNPYAKIPPYAQALQPRPQVGGGSYPFYEMPSVDGDQGNNSFLRGGNEYYPRAAPEAQEYEPTQSQISQNNDHSAFPNHSYMGPNGSQYPRGNPGSSLSLANIRRDATPEHRGVPNPSVNDLPSRTNSFHPNMMITPDNNPQARPSNPYSEEQHDMGGRIYGVPTHSLQPMNRPKYEPDREGGLVAGQGNMGYQSALPNNPQNYHKNPYANNGPYLSGNSNGYSGAMGNNANNEYMGPGVAPSIGGPYNPNNSVQTPIKLR